MADAPPKDDLRGPARVAMVAALSVIAAFIAGKAARDGILLAYFDVRWLPVFVGTAAAISLPLVLLAGKLLARLGPGRLLPVVNTVSAAMLVGEWFVLEGSPQLAAVLVFYHLSSLGAVLVSGFWSVVNERFDAQVAKRHIGRIGMSATIGGILGGVIAERTAVYFSLGTILLVLAGLQFVCAVLLRALGRGAAHPEPHEQSEPHERFAAVKTVAKTPLLRYLAFIVIIGAIAAAALDYVFKAEVTAATGREGALRFFAIFYTTTNILTAVVQTLFSRAAVTKVGVARSVGSLPLTVSVFGIVALAIPGLVSAVVARSAEMVTRSSVYRAAYELVYAPLPPERKRSTKVLIDVGAERVGDLLGAWLVGLLIAVIAAPHSVLLFAGVLAGVTGLAFALLLPRSYTAALEHSLVVQAKGDDPDQDSPNAWTAWNRVGPPTMTEAGDLTALSLLNLRATPRRPQATNASGSWGWRRRKAREGPAPASRPKRDRLPARIADLRSGDVNRVRRALETPLAPELAAHCVPLIGWDPVATRAGAALRAIASRVTGVLVDALLDPEQDAVVRRRVPAILVQGDPGHAAWGLAQALHDPQFEVRFRSARALAKLLERGHARALPGDDVFEIVKRELSVTADVWQKHVVEEEENGDEDAMIDPAVRERMSRGLEHVFNLFTLVLPAEPVRIALHGLHTDDRALRATALEYLESVLPADVRELLWPLVEVEEGPRQDLRASDELASELSLSMPKIIANLRAFTSATTPRK